MTDFMSNKHIIHHLINTIRDEHAAIVFLGAGSSIEGRQGDKPYPGFEALIDRVLEDYGHNPNGITNRLEAFRAIIKSWEDEGLLPIHLRKYLEGEPGTAHYYLAALVISLFPDSNLLLFLTTNYDDLMKKAFKDLERNPVKSFNTITLPLIKHRDESETEKVLNIINIHRKDTPVIFKLFGDLDSQSPIFEQKKMTFSRVVDDQLREWMKSSLIFIGYNFSDVSIKNTLYTSRGKAPVFIVTPNEDIPKDIAPGRRVYHIRETFFDFLVDVLGILPEKMLSSYEKIDKILRVVDPTLLYSDFNSIEQRINICSRSSLMRVEEKLPKSEIRGNTQRVIMVPRNDTSPDFHRFMKEDRPVLAVVGDSGTGKSTLFYQIASQRALSDQFITLFYDAHHLQVSGSLTSRLAHDFRCETRQLEDLLHRLDKILSAEGKRLLVLIDGINESIQVDPLSLKSDIEDLGSKLPPTIKIAYSCRRVYWDTYIRGAVQTPSELYYGSREFLLARFSHREAELAFASYQQVYKFRGVYESLKNELKEKIRDPLMLRMLAEGYKGKDLPNFAPAVLIFNEYEGGLRKKFQPTVLMDFLDELISLKLEEAETSQTVSDQILARSVRIHPKLSPLVHQQSVNHIRKGDPLVLLEDEGILSSLDEGKTIYRFTYDRFFEYLLGKEIGRKLNFSNRENFIKSTSDKISIYQRVHFSFIEGLKSEIIRLNIIEPKGIWSFFDATTLKLLLNDPDIAVVNFTKDVLRELTFESNKDILKALKEVTDDELSWRLLALDVAGDSPRIKPILLDGIFSGNKHFTRRCIEILLILNEDPIVRKNFENSIISEIKNITDFKKEHATGLIYYTGALFLIEDRIGNDPFEKVKIFWRTVLLSIWGDINNVKSIITSEFTRIVKDEAPLFFGSKFIGSGREYYGIEYLWKVMSKDERDMALKMAPLIIDPKKPIDHDSQEIIKFFGSEIKDWRKRGTPEKNPNYTYELEYRIAVWILLQHSQTKYGEVKDILERFVNTGFWLSIDFALCVMRDILQFIHHNNIKIIEDGFITMKRWTEKYEKETARFYDALKEDNPYLINFIPLEPATRIDILYFAPKEGPVHFLEERLTSSDPRNVQLALLCTRYFWKDHPHKILGTLELLIDSEDSNIKDSLERILKEIYLVYPRLIEDFFWRNNISPTRAQSIKYRTDVLDSTGFRHDSHPLYKALFLRSRKRRISFLEWYTRLFDSPNLDSYCHELSDFLFGKIMD